MLIKFVKLAQGPKNSPAEVNLHPDMTFGMTFNPTFHLP